VNKVNPIASRALKKAATISLFLSSIKLMAFLATGSLVILATFFDSVSDTIMSMVNSKINERAQVSADREHPFGHGGFEVLSTMIQGLVIMCFGFVVVGRGMISVC